MKNIFYAIFYAGALFGVMAFDMLSAAPAVLLVIAFPLIGLYLAERFGYFEVLEEPPSKFPILDKVHAWGMEDDEAYKTYGHAIVNEMNAYVEDLRREWVDAVQSRDRFIENVKGMKP